MSAGLYPSLVRRLQIAVREWQAADVAVKAAESERSKKSAAVEELRAISGLKTLDIEGYHIARLGGTDDPRSPLTKDLRLALLGEQVSIGQIERAMKRCAKPSKAYTRITPIAEEKS